MRGDGAGGSRLFCRAYRKPVISCCNSPTWWERAFTAPFMTCVVSRLVCEERLMFSIAVTIILLLAASSSHAFLTSPIPVVICSVARTMWLLAWLWERVEILT